MVLVFEFLDPALEELECVVAVEGDARAEHADEREALVLDGLLHEHGQVPGIGTEAPRNEGRAVHDRRSDRIERKLHAAVRRTLGLHVERTGWRQLARGQAVDLVVHDDIGEVHVAARRVREVIAADPVAVAVAAGDDHVQFMIGHLCTGRHRKGASVQRMHAVGVEVTGKVGRAADAADGENFVGFEAHFQACLAQAVEDAEIAASRAPVGIDLALVFVCRLRIENELPGVNAIHNIGFL